MRAIKFRAWDAKKRVMKQVAAGYKNEGIAMQYTGLKDARGREIYEGDILATIPLGSVRPEYRERILGEVCWNEYKRGHRAPGVILGWVIRQNNQDRDVSLDVWMEVMDGSKSEVVGNIFENPKLMELGLDKWMLKGADDSTRLLSTQEGRDGMNNKAKTEVLLIGGSRDGERIEIWGLDFWIEIPKRFKAGFYRPSSVSVIDLAEPPETEIYKRVEFGDNNEDAFVIAYREAGLSINDFMRRLLDNYLPVTTDSLQNPYGSEWFKRWEKNYKARNAESGAEGSPRPAKVG